jgi:hypothetical protein
MFPLRFGADLLGVFELGRSDHPFRERDAEVFEAVSKAALARLLEIG